MLSLVLTYLDSQRKRPYIVVINDGSTDDTAGLLRDHDIEHVITKEPHKGMLGTTYIIKNTLEGFRYLIEYYDPDYLMKLDDDVLLPNHYTSEITDRMAKHDIVYASGIVREETQYHNIRDNLGVVNTAFLSDLITEDVTLGLWSRIYWEARYQNRGTRLYTDLKVSVLRPTGTNYDSRVFFVRGLMHKSLGYTLSWAMLKSAYLTRTWGIYAGISFMRGYRSGKVTVDAGLAGYVARHQWGMAKTGIKSLYSHYISKDS